LKPIVLVFVRFYLPAYKSGGPVRTIANLVEHLGSHFEFRIVCSDRDSFEDVSFPNIEVNSWNRVGNASVFYASRGFMRFGNIRRLLRATAHDVLYLNSFFAPRFTILPLLAERMESGARKPVIVAPRGEFSASALAIRRLRKRCYIALAKLLGVYENVTWQASSPYEATDIRQTLQIGEELVVIAPNLPSKIGDDEAQWASEERAEGAVLRVVFLSRVSVVKNLDFALHVVSRVRVPLVFDVFGLVDNPSYWARCKALAGELPDNVSFAYRGVVPHEYVKDIMSGYDLFFLPTQGENYGHAILESLAAGTPPLISDRTPWRDLDEAGAGFVRPLGDPEAYVAVIEGLASESRERRLRRRRRACAYARQTCVNEEAVVRNLSLLSNVVKGVVR